ncbi:hypothetical protein BS17DRAFT_757004 [Gyrodon lividus]|nr:hypothetical protein BS17DRAFT_757004 [Gyrodon lividus]
MIPSPPARDARDEPRLPLSTYNPSPNSTTSPLGSSGFTTVPSPWTACIHPQGWLYFFHPEFRIIATEDIRDPHAYDIVMGKIPQYTSEDTESELEFRLYGLSPQHVPLDHLIINHKHSLASHNLQEVQSKNILSLTSHQFSRARSNYWQYMRHYPVHMPTPENALQEAVDALIWYFTDNLVSGASSTVPFSKEECEELLRLLQHSNIYSGPSPSKTVFLAWILEEVYRFRHAEHYGKFAEKQGREFRNQNMKPRRRQPTRHNSLFVDKLLNVLMVVFFFGIPWTYLAHVKSASTYKGRLANLQNAWDAYITRLVQEYSNFLLIATVLLAATVSFLNVPDIGQGGLFACIVSTLFSLGSIIVGVFCIWRHQTNTTTTASFSYMYNVEHTLGLHGHAMLLSLPPVLLVWAIVTFTVSIIAYALQSVNTNSLTIGTAWAIVGVFVLILMSVSMVLYAFSTIWKWQPPMRFCVGTRAKV